MNFSTRFRFPFMLTALAVLATAGCDDGITDHDDDHAEPVAVQIRLGGQVIASATPTSATGTLTISAGEESAHYSVVFVDEDGDVLTPDDDEFLEVVVASSSVAEWEQDTPGEFGGHLHGETAGTTTAVFRLMHGTVGSSSAHADFISTGIQVVVN